MILMVRKETNPIQYLIVYRQKYSVLHIPFFADFHTKSFYYILNYDDRNNSHLIQVVLWLNK